MEEAVGLSFPRAGAIVKCCSGTTLAGMMRARAREREQEKQKSREARKDWRLSMERLAMGGEGEIYRASTKLWVACVAQLIYYKIL